MRNKRTWTGNARATIDPNHTPAVEGDHYLTATTPDASVTPLRRSSRTPNTICCAERSRPR